MVEEEEVLALDVEDQRLGVGGLGPEDPRVEHRVEEERRVRGLRRHARDARDVDMRAAGAVDELKVGEERTVVAPEPDDETLLHLVEVQGAVTGISDGDLDLGARGGVARRSPARPG